MHASIVAEFVALQLTAAAASEVAVGDAALFEAEFAGVKEGVTAAEWIARHPADTIEPFASRIRGDDTNEWCVRARLRGKLADGTEFTRTAYFYDPDPPRNLAFPLGPPSRLRGACRLGLVWIEAPLAARDAMVRAAKTIWGPASAADALSSDLTWTDAESWSVGSLRVSVARGVGTSDLPVLRRRAVARLTLAMWDLSPERLALDECGLGVPADTQEYVRTLALSVVALRGIDPAARAAMLALLGGHDFWENTPRVTTADVVAAFTPWMKAFGELPANERAAALLAADEIMSFLNGHGWGPDEDGSAGDKLHLAGATFAWLPIGGGYWYAHSFLRDALAITPGGPQRDRLLLREMEIGFDYSGMCDSGAFPLEQVIATGEPLIRRNSDPAMLAKAHLLVGDAYATIVALANGAGGDYVDEHRFEARATKARRSSLVHYRSGLAMDSSSRQARCAWRSAWRLAAGVPPTQGARYWCVYD